MPGKVAFSLISWSKSANALLFSCLASSMSPPERQYFATVFRSIPCLLAMSLKLGLVPDCRYMLNSPIRFLSNPAPFVVWDGGSVT